MTKVSKSDPILSIVLLNYNFGEYLVDCLKSLDRSVLTDQIEIIVADNASSDDSFVKSQKQNFINSKIKYIFHQNGKNYGFAKGNNLAIKLIQPNTKYVLFLNPDTAVNSNTIQGMISYFRNNPRIDSATCHINLATNGKLQPECHRGFPTPWNTFWYFFGFGLPKLFPKLKLINGYLMEYLDYSTLQQIDCCVGAFFMMKIEVGKKVGWWNEKYFFNGEDLDFCYKLKQLGYTVYFIPDYKITHYQGVSSGIKKTKSSASTETKIRTAKATTRAMRIFYQENILQDYPHFIHPVINLGISLLESFRVFKARYL